jgi:uncharacterized membrane protein
LHLAAKEEILEQRAAAPKPRRSSVSAALIGIGLLLLAVLVVTGAITLVSFLYRMLVA